MAIDSKRAFLRSINLVYDAGSTECVEYFYPTSKAAALIATIMGTSSNERSTFVVAPYGSGKSLAAMYALQVIENQNTAQDMLALVAERMRPFAGDLSQYIIDRVNRSGHSRDRGVVVTLHGSVKDLADSIRKAALDSISRLGLIGKAKHLENTNCETADDLLPFIRHLIEFARKQKLCQIAVIWDEFGKHLETLISEGRSTELIEVQQLAEICSRQQKIPVTLTLLMHQGLGTYATGLPQSARNEWSKVAGRFREIRYVDNSKEIYQLIGRIMSANGKQPRYPNTLELSSNLRELGLFEGFKTGELSDLLKDSSPLDPVTLYLLPRISARVAQNERTLFSFLNDIDGDRSIGPDVIYDYFSNEMHADISVGGTNKQWLQAESAITHCDGDPKQVKAIKCACLLGMGLLGERTKAPQELLIMALRGCDTTSRQEADETVQILIKKKLLLHRRHNDSISVWHGTDFDIRGKLEDLKIRFREQFDVVAFLNKEAPPRAWRPLRYNSEYRICRYCPGFYADLQALQLPDLLALEKNGYYNDAKIIYFIPNDDKEIETALQFAQGVQSPRVGIFVPSKPIALIETALEVFCLIQLSVDQKLISQDPLLPVEISQMLDDARVYLQQLTDRFTTPGDDVSIYFGGTKWDITNKEAFNESLSKLMEDRFHLTPIINNELIVRRNVSKPIQNARKKLVMGILEHGGEKAFFGFSDTEIRTPQASMYSSVLVHTGLYDPNEKKPRFNQPENISDQGMRYVWSELKAFYSDSGECSFAELISKLQSPPYGIRTALLPVLLAAGYKAFARSVVLWGPSGYLTDLMSSTFEQICMEPAEYVIRVIPLSAAKDRYLSALAWLFFYGEESVDDKDAQGILNREKELLRQVYEAFCKWRAELPAAALSVDGVSSEARSFQQILRQTQIIPDVMFLTTLPSVMGCDGPGPKTIKAIAAVIHELTNVVSAHQRHTEKIIRDAFSLSLKNKLGLLESAVAWTKCFSREFQTTVPDLVARRVFSLVRDYSDSEERFVDELALILVGKSVIHWDPATFERFSEKLNEMVNKMHRLVFKTLPSDKDSDRGIQMLLKAELERLRQKIEKFGLSIEDIMNILQ